MPEKVHYGKDRRGIMLSNYFENQFLKDFGTLSFKRYDNPINKHVEYFFGGNEWNDIKTDLSQVKPENYEDFILSLFFIELVEMNMYSNYSESYNQFRAKTLFPKFGYVGMGPHYSYPQNLILFAAKHEYLDLNNIYKRAPEIAEVFHKQYVENYEGGVFPIPADNFFKKIFNDKDNFVVDSEGFFSEIMKEILKLV
jgi:hypothetical protein